MIEQIAGNWISTGITVLLFGLLLHGCVVPADSPEKELLLVHDSVPDTISPWDSIAVVFSRPIRDSLVVFTVTPSLYMYSQRMCDSRDTVVITSVEPFDGSTRYVIRPAEKVTAEDGAVLEPENDSLIIMTAPCEREPNGDLLKADSLKNYRFGTVATVNDTDCFLLIGNGVDGVFLSSFETQSTCFIQDDDGRRTSARSFVQSDTIEVPDDFSPPLYVKVFCYNRSSGGSYKVGSIPSGN